MKKSVILLLAMTFYNLTAKGPQAPYALEPVSIVKGEEGIPLKYVENVHVTMYNAVPEQTDSTPDIVADGTRFDPNMASQLRWIAVSRDLLHYWGGPLYFGDVVYLEILKDPIKSGFYRVKDTMNPRFTNRVDILETLGTSLYQYPEATLFFVSPAGKEPKAIRHLIS